MENSKRNANLLDLFDEDGNTLGTHEENFNRKAWLDVKNIIFIPSVMRSAIGIQTIKPMQKNPKLRCFIF